MAAPRTDAPATTAHGKAAGKEMSPGTATHGEPAHRRPARWWTAYRQTAHGQTAHRQTAHRETAQRRTAHRPTADRRTADRHSPDRRAAHRKAALPQAPHGGGPAAVGRLTVLLFAVTCGVAVGNVYFPQAVSPVLADGLGVPPGAAATVVTAVQLGYAAGIFLLVPLGDRFRHRPLLVTLLAVAALGLLCAAAAPGLPPLVAASAAVGVATVVAPLVGSMAAGLVPEERRGAVSGTLLSGSLGGMLLSRTFGGSLAEDLGWRAPYLLAAALTLTVALALARALPRAVAPVPSRQRYPALLAETVRLLRTEPQLRRSCCYQAAVFAGFSAVWTAVALLLTGPVHGLGAGAVGALALVNAVTMLCTPFAGRQVDRRGPDAVNAVAVLTVLVAAAVLLCGTRGGAVGLAALVAGTLLLDVGMQSGMVANQVRIYTLRAEVRSRLSTAYMTCAYLGGSLGSWAGAHAYGLAGWPAVSALLALLAAFPGGDLLLRRRRAALRETAPRKAAPGKAAPREAAFAESAPREAALTEAAPPKATPRKATRRNTGR
ncbi:Major facilitator superfamily (MFS) profile domain-containing protein [Streptomyces albus]